MGKVSSNNSIHCYLVIVISQWGSKTPTPPPSMPPPPSPAVQMTTGCNMLAGVLLHAQIHRCAGCIIMSHSAGGGFEPFPGFP